MKERDEARAALINWQAVAVSAPAVTNSITVAAPNGSDKMDVESVTEVSGLPASTIAKINDKCAELSKHRKNNKPLSEGSYSKDAVASQSQVVSSFTPHAASKGAIHSLALSSGEASHFLTGGADKDVLLSDRTTGAVLVKMTGHSKKVNSVAFHPSADSHFTFSGSSDKTVKVWNTSDAATNGGTKSTVLQCSAVATLQGHASDVTSISMHPSG